MMTLKQFHRRPCTQAGFTLVEMLVVLVIVSLALTAAMAALATGAISVNHTTANNTTLNLTQACMEVIKGQPFVPAPAPTPTPAPCPSVTPPSSYSVSYTIGPVPTAVPGYGDPQGSNIEQIVVSVTRNSTPQSPSLTGFKVNRP